MSIGSVRDPVMLSNKILNDLTIDLEAKSYFDSVFYYIPNSLSLVHLKLLSSKGYIGYVRAPYQTGIVNSKDPPRGGNWEIGLKVNVATLSLSLTPIISLELVTVATASYPRMKSIEGMDEAVSSCVVDEQPLKYLMLVTPTSTALNGFFIFPIFPTRSLPEAANLIYNICPETLEHSAAGVKVHSSRTVYGNGS